MYSSDAFGRIFWVDDNMNFKSCPQNIDETGDFDHEDYVSEWTDWDGVNTVSYTHLRAPRDS